MFSSESLKSDQNGIEMGDSFFEVLFISCVKIRPKWDWNSSVIVFLVPSRISG